MARSPRLRVGPGASVMVVGAGGLVGRACAQALAARGARVGCADLNLGAASQTAMATGGLAVGLDAADPAMWGNALQVAENAYGPVSLIVLAAGAHYPAWALEQPQAEIDALIGSNLLSVVHGLRAGIDYLRRNGGGRIVTVGALVPAYLPQAGDALYAATHHGQRAYHESVAAEYRSAALRFSYICAGPAAGSSTSGTAALPTVELSAIAAAVLRAADDDRAHIVVAKGRHRWLRLVSGFPGAAARLAARLRARAAPP